MSFEDVLWQSSGDKNRLNALKHKTQLRRPLHKRPMAQNAQDKRPSHCVLLTSAVTAVSQLHAEFSGNNQKRQRMYVYKRRFSWTIAAMKKQYAQHYIYWVCMCGFGFPACNAHALYCHLWPVWLYYIFPLYLINGIIFGKKNTERKMCFNFL